LSRSVWGYLSDEQGAVAAYYVQWTLNRVAEHGAHFDFILGKWGEGTSATDRIAVSLEFHRAEKGPAFMVIDASSRPVSENTLVGRALRRDEVVGTALAKTVFALTDVVWLQDDRIAEVRGAAEQALGADETRRVL
jgi:hypothetical protein